MLVRLYDGFPVYGCAENEEEKTDLRRIWENEYFNVIYVFTVLDRKVFYEIIQEVGGNCEELGIIALLGNTKIVTNMNTVREIMREKGYREREYSTIRDLF